MNRFSVVRSFSWKKIFCGISLCAQAALLQAGSQGVLIHSFNSPTEAARWTFNNGGEFPGARGSFAVGGGADGANTYGELRYDFTPPSPVPSNFNPHYVQAIRALDAAEARGVTRARLRVWGSQTNARYFFRWFDSTGQVFQSASLFANAPEDGQFRTLALDLRSKSFSWGGAADGVVHFPITKIAVVCDATGQRGTGWIRVDDVELLSEVQEIPAGPDSLVVLNSFAVAGEDSQWKFYNGSEYPGARGGVYTGVEDGTQTPYMELRYDFTPPSPLPTSFNPHYVQASRSLTLAESAGHNTRLRFKAQKSRPEITLNLRWVDASGQTFQTHVNGSESLEQTAEALHALTLDLRSAPSYWGGANDGLTRFPLKSIAFVCDATGFRDTGWIRVADIKLLPEVEAPAVKFDSATDISEWRFGNGGEFPGARGSLSRVSDGATSWGQLNYDFSRPATWTGTFDPRYVEAWRPLPANVSGVRLRFTVTADDIPVRIRYVDSAGQTFQATLTNGLATEGLAASTWIERAHSFVPVNTRWGGPGDGVVRLPIKRMSIVLDAAKHRDTGHLKFDDLVLVTEAIPEIELGSGPLVAPRWGSGTLTERSGVSVHFTTDNRSMDAIKAAGFGWIRMDAYWDVIERIPGAYNFSGYDALVSAAEQRGLWTIAILNYGNVAHTGTAMSPPKTTAALAAYENYCAAMAARYAGRKVVFEVWNEPDVPAFWGGASNVHEFSKLLARGFAGVRRGNPSATVFSGGLSSVHSETYRFFRTQIASGAMSAASGMGVHLYGTGYPELQWDNVIRLKAMAKSATGGELWCSEWGFSSADLSPAGNGHDAMGRHIQASFAVRQLFIGWWSNMPVTVLYDILDDGPSAAEPEHNYGLLAKNYSEKPAMLAVKKFFAVSKGRTLAGLLKPTGLPPGMHIAKLNGAADTVYMVWSEEPASESLLSIADLRAVVVDMYGNRLGCVRAGNKLTISVKAGTGPVYVTTPR